MNALAATRTQQLENELHNAANLLQRRSDEMASLLRLPFEIEIETPATFGLAPEDSAPASYAYVHADDDLVRQAVDDLIEAHMAELEGKVAELQLARWKAQRDDA